VKQRDRMKVFRITLWLGIGVVIGCCAITQPAKAQTRDHSVAKLGRALSPPPPAYKLNPAKDRLKIFGVRLTRL